MFTQTIKELEELPKQGIIPGISYRLYSPETVYSHVEGWKQTEPAPIPLDAAKSYRYDIASLTKVIATTTRMLQLLEAKRVHLHDTVSAYLPEFRFPDVTLSQLLTHSSGLAKNIPGYTIETPAAVKQYCYDTPLQSEPGSKVAYADVNFLLLGFIIEQLDGDFAASIQANVVDPLELKETGFAPIAADVAIPTEWTRDRGLIQGEVHDYKAWRNGGAAGHAGLFSSLTDLGRFVHCLLFESGKPLFQTTDWQQLISTKQTASGVLDRAIGWDLVASGNHYASYHTGFTGTFIVIDFIKQTALIALSNRVHPTRNNPAFLEARNHIVTTFLSES